jgi:hypothetical protein
VRAFGRTWVSPTHPEAGGFREAVDAYRGVARDAAVTALQTLDTAGGRLRATVVDTFRVAGETVRWVRDEAGRGLAVLGERAVAVSEQATRAFVGQLERLGRSARELWALADRFGQRAPQVMQALISNPAGLARALAGGVAGGFGQFLDLNNLQRVLPQVVPQCPRRRRRSNPPAHTTT